MQLLTGTLGDRMKAYEAATSTVLPDKCWAVIRLDGKAFHSYTRNLDKPFSKSLHTDMDLLMKFLCTQIEGAVFAYTQSDEISIILHNLSSPNQQLWFDGKVQKIVSVTASYAGACWAKLRRDGDNYGVFDARVFALPCVEEVINYLLWRQRDCEKNAVFMAASEYFSHKELTGKTAQQKISMLENLGEIWLTDYTDRQRWGAVCGKVAQEGTVFYTRKDTGEQLTTKALRTFWVSRSAPYFSETAIDSPVFSFLRPLEQLCQPQEFLS